MGFAFSVGVNQLTEEKSFSVSVISSPSIVALIPAKTE